VDIKIWINSSRNKREQDDMQHNLKLALLAKEEHSVQENWRLTFLRMLSYDRVYFVEIDPLVQLLAVYTVAWIRPDYPSTGAFLEAA
jgi:hypothetical protein